nr:spindle assembly abnormal protein 6 homolog [Aegilops tauschii subsp. strangulata]
MTTSQSCPYEAKVKKSRRKYVPDFTGVVHAQSERAGEDDNDGPKCPYVHWVDLEWPPQLRTSLARIWDMYEEEVTSRIREAVDQAEEYVRVVKEKEQMEKDLRFFKLDFAKMVADKEQAITELGNTRLALSDLKVELEKKRMGDKSVTNIHQVARAKAEKERDEMKQEKDKMMEERDKLKEERDQLKKEVKKLEYMIGDLFKHKEDTKCKIRKVGEMLDEFE